MKKLVICVLVLFAGSLIALSSCSSSSKIGGNVEGDSVRTEGWIDDDTFRIAASCQSKEDVTNVVTRKNYATRCATIYAKYMIRLISFILLLFPYFRHVPSPLFLCFVHILVPFYIPRCPHIPKPHRIYQ